MTTPDTERPASATYREVLELLRTFAASGWTGLTLDLPGLHITAGRHGPPPAAFTAATPPTAASPVTTPPPAPQSSSVPSITPVAPHSAVSTAPPPPSSTPPPPAPSTTPDTTGSIPVRSPAVGSFWVAPSPGSPPFVEPGQTVAEGDQLAIVEVMKLMNPVTAPQAGQVVQVCATNAELVEYDQVLFLIRPAGG